jgi:hypothetical protein
MKKIRYTVDSLSVSSMEDAIREASREPSLLVIEIVSEPYETLSLETILKDIAMDSIIDVWSPEFVMCHGDCSKEVAIEALKLMQEEYDIEVGYNIEVMYCAVNQCNTPKAITKRYLASLGISLNDVLLDSVLKIDKSDLIEMISHKEPFKVSICTSSYPRLWREVVQCGIMVCEETLVPHKWLVLRVDCNGLYSAVFYCDADDINIQVIELI